LSTFQKMVLGGVMAAVLFGGAAWAAVAASNSQETTLAVPAPGGLRLPGRFGPGGATGPVGRLRPGFPGSFGRLGGAAGFGGPLGGPGFLCGLANAELSLVEGGTRHHMTLESGTLASVSSYSLRMTESVGSTVTIPVGQDTKVLVGGREGSLSDLQEGDSVFSVREESGPARTLRLIDADRDPCSRIRGGGPLQLAPSPSPSPSSG
jgi:hypothetical protein